jgi:preprotein translocase subunit YajC
VEGLGGLLLPLVFLFVLYLLLIRPQQKRQKAQQQMVADLEVGDDVVTVGGLHGRVQTLTDDTMDLEVDAEGTVLRFQRSSVGRVIRDEPEIE